MTKKDFYSQKTEDLIVSQYGQVLTKQNLAHLLKVSVSSINNYIVKGEGVPEYIKVGNGKKGKVLFPVVNVVSYMSNTIKVS